MRVLFVAVMLVCGGCSAFSSEKELPVNTGSGRDEFPRSPCACGAPFYVDGKFV